VTGKEKPETTLIPTFSQREKERVADDRKITIIGRRR